MLLRHAPGRLFDVTSGTLLPHDTRGVYRAHGTETPVDLIVARAWLVRRLEEK